MASLNSLLEDADIIIDEVMNDEKKKEKDFTSGFLENTKALKAAGLTAMP